MVAVRLLPFRELIVQYAVSRLVVRPDGSRAFKTKRGSVFLPVSDYQDQEAHQFIRERVADRVPGWIICGYWQKGGRG